ncbi:hypothetical protein ACJZ2D_003034 [Fusarium nematophilum]
MTSLRALCLHLILLISGGIWTRDACNTVAAAAAGILAIIDGPRAVPKALGRRVAGDETIGFWTTDGRVSTFVCPTSMTLTTGAEVGGTRYARCNPTTMGEKTMFLATSCYGDTVYFSFSNPSTSADTSGTCGGLGCLTLTLYGSYGDGSGDDPQYIVDCQGYYSPPGDVVEFFYENPAKFMTTESSTSTSSSGAESAGSRSAADNAEPTDTESSQPSTSDSSDAGGGSGLGGGAIAGIVIGVVVGLGILIGLAILIYLKKRSLDILQNAQNSTAPSDTMAQTVSSVAAPVPAVSSAPPVSAKPELPAVTSYSELAAGPTSQGWAASQPQQRPYEL